MRKQSGQVHSRESPATLQLTVSLLYRWGVFSMEKCDVLRYNYCVKYIYETLYNTHKI